MKNGLWMNLIVFILVRVVYFFIGFFGTFCFLFYLSARVWILLEHFPIWLTLVIATVVGVLAALAGPPLYNSIVMRGRGTLAGVRRESRSSEEHR